LTERPAGRDAIVIRDATDADLPAVAELTRRAYAEFASVMEPAAWEGLSAAVDAALASAGPVDRIVADAGGTIVGSVFLFPPAAQAYGDLAGASPGPELRLLAVAQDARGMGVGRALVDECANRARRAGATELGLHTSRSMRAAMRLYSDLGFVRAPDRDFFPPGSEIVEAYRLVLA
jgi:GNAT superfamily N-acetyltransferase